MAQGDVFWVGQDGNPYMKTAATGWNVVQAGRGDIANLRTFATEISDPVASSQSQAPAGGGSGGGGRGGGGSAPAFNQAGADNTQRTIDQIGPLLQAALESEATNHQNTVNAFNAQEGQQRDTYGKSTVTNTKNYDSNFMDSIRAGIHGLGGLMSLLRGTGASGGTAETQARDAVGGVTAQDIRGGADTRDENQSALDSSLSQFLSDLKQKRQGAEDTFANNEAAIRRDSNTQLQDLYGKMAGFYGDAGNGGAANDWMGRAGDLTPAIAADSRTQRSLYDTTPVVVHAPNLTAFAGPTQPDIVAPPSDGQVGSGIFTMSDPRRRKDETAPVAPVPAGA